MHGRDNSKFFIQNIRYEFLICLLLVVTILGIYLQVRNFDFIKLDDTLYITDNNKVQAGLTMDSMIWAFTTGHGAYWMPITWLSHMVDCQLYGVNPGAHHLINVLFHILNTILLFLFFKITTDKLWQSTFVAALFALHPLHVESVAWIAERKDVLSTFFLLLTLFGYKQYVEKYGIKNYLLSLLFFTFGLMAKPMIVTLPFVLLLLDYWPLERMKIPTGSVSAKGKNDNGIQTSRLILEKVPFFVFAGLSSFVTLTLHLKDGSVASLSTLSIGDRIANALVSYVSYILKMFFPFNLAVLYPYPSQIPSWQIIGSGLFLIIISCFAVWAMKGRPYFIMGWLWYLGTLVPVIGLLHAGLHAMADRFTYIPLIGLFVIVAWGIPDFLSAWQFKRIGLVILSFFTLFSLLMISIVQTGYWRDSITLFKHTLNITSNNYLISHNLNVALREAGRQKEADKYYYDALRIRYGSTGKYRNIFGMALMNQHRYDEAIIYFDNMLKESPDDVEILINLGNAMAAKGRLDEAVEKYLSALEIIPDFAEAYNNLGLIFLRKGRIEDAVTHFYEALKYNPGYDAAKRNLSRAISDLKAIDNAVADMTEALKIDPYGVSVKIKVAALSNSKINLENVINRLNKSLSTQPGYKKDNIINWEKIKAVKKEYTKMLPVFKKVAHIHPDLNEVYYHVACSYAIEGKTATSMQWLRKAVEHGFDNWELFSIDKDLKNIEKTEYYRNLLKKNENQ